MEDKISLLIRVTDNNILVLSHDSVDKLSSIKDILKDDISGLKVIDIDKEKYEQSKNDLKACEELIKSYL